MTVHIARVEQWLASVPVTDYVSIRDLSISAVIGVHDWEREIEQPLIVSVDMVPTTADVRHGARDPTTWRTRLTTPRWRQRSPPWCAKASSI